MPQSDCTSCFLGLYSRQLLCCTGPWQMKFPAEISSPFRVLSRSSGKWYAHRRTNLRIQAYMYIHIYTYIYIYICIHGYIHVTIQATCVCVYIFYKYMCMFTAVKKSPSAAQPVGTSQFGSWLFVALRLFATTLRIQVPMQRGPRVSISG